MGRKICLVGFSELSREWANEQEADVEIWGMNEDHVFLQRYDRWFQIHPRNWNERTVNSKGFTFSAHCNTCGWEQTGKPDQAEAVIRVKALGQKHANKHPEHEVEAGTEQFSTDGYGRTPHHLRWLMKCLVPVYMQKVDERIPNAVRFPFEEITEELGIEDIDGKKRLYMTSSVAWMLALAVYEHRKGQTIDEIRTPGIELMIGTEYARQRPCFEWWLGMAMGMGIKWIRPPGGSSLLSDGIYAIDYLETQRFEAEMMQPLYFDMTGKEPMVQIAEPVA